MSTPILQGAPQSGSLAGMGPMPTGGQRGFNPAMCNLFSGLDPQLGNVSPQAGFMFGGQGGQAAGSAANGAPNQYFQQPQGSRQQGGNAASAPLSYFQRSGGMPNQGGAQPQGGLSYFQGAPSSPAQQQAMPGHCGQSSATPGQAENGAHCHEGDGAQKQSGEGEHCSEGHGEHGRTDGRHHEGRAGREHGNAGRHGHHGQHGPQPREGMGRHEGGGACGGEAGGPQQGGAAMPGTANPAANGGWNVPMGANPKNHLDETGRQNGPNGMPGASQQAGAQQQCGPEGGRGDGRGHGDWGRGEHGGRRGTEDRHGQQGHHGEHGMGGRPDMAGPQNAPPGAGMPGQAGAMAIGRNAIDPHGPVPPESPGSADRTYQNFIDPRRPGAGNTQHPDKVDQYKNVYSWDQNYNRYEASGKVGGNGSLQPYTDSQYVEKNKLPVPPQAQGSENRQYSDYVSQGASAAESGNPQHKDQADQYGNVYTWDRNYNRYMACGTNDAGTLKPYSDHEYAQYNGLNAGGAAQPQAHTE